MDTIKDLYESSIPILTNEMEWRDKFVKLLEDISNYGGWSGKVRGVPLAQLKSEFESFNDSVAYFALDYDVLAYVEVQKRLDLKLYHVLLSETLGRHLITYQLNADFPFIDTINGIVHRLNGAGLIEKWATELEENLSKKMLEKNLKRFKLKSDVVGGFFVPTAVWCGWIASLVVFSFELIWNKFKSCRI